VVFFNFFLTQYKAQKYWLSVFSRVSGGLFQLFVVVGVGNSK
jgi:hypothetical protein